MSTKEYLTQNKIFDLPSEDRFLAVVQLVAKIPWGECRSVDEVLKHNKGTCTGKHLFLQECLDEIGIPYTPVVCTFRWRDQPVHYPIHLRSILDEGVWDHGHNFVRVSYNGIDVDVDITWNSKLAKYGFTCLPPSWNGTESFVGVQHIQRRWDNADIRDMKKSLFDGLSENQRELRERFLHEFIKWVDSINT